MGVQFDVQKLNILILKFMFVIVALKAQKRIAQGRAQRHPGLFHVAGGRAESAKAQMTAGYLTLLRFGFYDNRDNKDNKDNRDNNNFSVAEVIPLSVLYVTL